VSGQLHPHGARLLTVTLWTVALIALSLFCGLFVHGALKNLFADYKDSPAGTYWAIGGLFFVFSALSALVALRSWARRARWWDTAAAVLVPTSFFPFVPALGDAGYGLHAAAVTGAVTCATIYLASGRLN
jgi:hypothetical protein